eukprot:3647665-Pyramimonas_sp.AAC.1
MNDLKNSVSSTAKFFGVEWKNVSRNWQNYHTYLINMMEDESDASILRDMRYLEKQVNAAKTVLGKVNILGLTSKDTV